MTRLQVNVLHQDDYIRQASLSGNSTFNNVIQGVITSKPTSRGLDDYFSSLNLHEYYVNPHQIFHRVMIDKINWLFEQRIQQQNPNIFGFTINAVTDNEFNNVHYFQMMEWIGALLRVVLTNLNQRQSTELEKNKIVKDACSTAFYFMIFTLMDQVHRRFGGSVFNGVELEALMSLYSKVDKLSRELSSSNIPLTEQPNITLNPTTIAVQQFNREHPQMHLVNQPQQQQHQYHADDVIQWDTNRGRVQGTYREYCAMMGLPDPAMAQYNHPQQQHINQQYHQQANMSFVQNHNGQQHQARSGGGHSGSSVGFVEDGPSQGSQQPRVATHEAAYVNPAVCNVVKEQTQQDSRTLVEKLRASVDRKYWFNDNIVVAAATGVKPEPIQGVKNFGDDSYIWNRLEDVYFYDFTKNANKPTARFIPRKSIGDAMELNEMSFRHPANPSKPFTPGFDALKNIQELEEKTGLPYESYINNLARDAQSTVDMEVFDPDESDEVQIKEKDDLMYLYSDMPITGIFTDECRVHMINLLEKHGITDYPGHEDVATTVVELDPVICEKVIPDDIVELKDALFTRKRNVGEVARALSIVTEISESYSKQLHERLVEECNFFLHVLAGVPEKFYIVDFYEDVIQHQYVTKLSDKLTNDDLLATKFEDHITKFMERELRIIVDPDKRKSFIEEMFNSTIEDTSKSITYKHILPISKPTILVNTGWSEAAIDTFSTSPDNDKILILTRSTLRYYKDIETVFAKKKAEEEKYNLRNIPVIMYSGNGNKYRIDASPYGDTFFVTPLVILKHSVKKA